MDAGFGQMEVSGLAGQTGNPENRQQEEIMTILSSGGERTTEFGIMSKILTAEEFYVNMTLQIHTSTLQGAPTLQAAPTLEVAQQPQQQ